MIEAFSGWLASTALSHAFQNTLWFVPVVQSAHILAIALSLTLIARVDLHVLGLGERAVSSRVVASGSLRWAWIGMLVLAASGVLLIITEPARELLNPLFQLKMLLVGMLAVLTWWLGGVLNRAPELAGARAPAAQKIAAVLSLTLLVAIVISGRWIAYIL